MLGEDVEALLGLATFLVAITEPLPERAERSPEKLESRTEESTQRELRCKDDRDKQKAEDDDQ